MERDPSVDWARGMAALAMIEPLAPALAGYFYFHGTRAALLEELGRLVEAQTAYETALPLCSTAAETALVKQRLHGLSEKTAAAVGFG